MKDMPEDNNKVLDLANLGLAVKEISPEHKSAWDTIGHVDPKTKSIENALPILKKYSKKLAKKFEENSELKFRDLSPLEQAKFLAAEQVALLGKKADTKENFASFRREHEVETVQEAQVILNNKFVESIVDKGPVEASFNRKSVAVQTTLRKIEEWSDVESVNNLKRSNPEAYAQFLFDVHIMGGKRTKKGVQTSLQRGISGPEVNKKTEPVISHPKPIAQQPIKSQAVMPPKVRAAIEARQKKSSTQRPRFLSIHTPEVTPDFLAKYVHGDVDKPEDKPVKPSPLKLTDADRVKVEPLDLASYSVESKPEKPTTLNLMPYRVEVEPAESIPKKSVPLNLAPYSVEPPKREIKLPSFLTEKGIPKIQQTPKPKPLRLTPDQRIDTLLDLRGFESDDSDSFVFNFKRVKPLTVIPQREPDVATLMDEGDIDFIFSETPRAEEVSVSDVAEALAPKQQPVPLRAPQRTTAPVEVPRQKRRFGGLRKAAGALAAVFALSVMPQAVDNNTDHTMTNIQPANAAGVLPSSNVEPLIVQSVPQGVTFVPVKLQAPRFNSESAQTFNVASINPLPKLVAPISHPKDAFVGFTPDPLPEVSPPPTVQERMLSGSLGFEDIPAVIKAFYEEKGVDISPELQKQLNKAEEGLANGETSYAAMGKYDGILIMVKQFGSDAVPLANAMLDIIVETENVYNAKKLAKNAIPYWQQKYATPKLSV